MYEPDDIRYTRAENRPPWELSPGGQLREWFSCRKVDQEGAEYCREVESHKQERIRAQQARREELHRRQADRRARQAARQKLHQDQIRSARRKEQRTFQAAQEAREQAAEAAGLGQRESAAPAGAPESPRRDPRGERYDYSGARPQPPRRGASWNGKTLGLIVAVALVAVSALMGFLEGNVSSQESPLPEEYSGAWPEDFGEIPWEDPPEIELPEDWDIYEEEGEETASQDTGGALQRAETGDAMELEIRSARGKTALTYQELYEKCLPSTVSITVYTEEGVGTGTGIVLTQDGYILTCHHVIEDGTSCTVTTYDDGEYAAQLVGGDAQTDLAVLKVDAQGLVPAEFGDSDQLTVGDEALAIGDPLGSELRGTLTNGIISAINRNVTVNGYSMTLLQTTAALNSGNSGGPLINIYGQVVGVNNMKMNSATVTVEGLGFAVPTTVVREILPILTAEGKVSRPVLGVTCYEIDEETAQRTDALEVGLQVTEVNEKSDAYAQGLQVGDYIVAVNGVPVTSVAEVKELISGLGIGDAITLDVVRYDDAGNRGELTIEIRLVDQSELD